MKAKFLMSAFISMMMLPATAQVTTSLPSQEESEVDVSLSTDIVNQYVWRGLEYGGVSIQPTLGVGYKGLSLSAWGNVGLSQPSDDKEIDLTLNYSLYGFNIGVTDYWFNNPEKRYFLYDAHRTSHVFEGNIGYDFGIAAIQWYTNFAGNDGANKDGKRAYSSYAEIDVPFKLATFDWTATVGAVPYATTWYGTTGFSVINLSLRATKNIKVTDTFSIPVFGQFVGNPRSQKAYLVFGITLQP